MPLHEYSGAVLHGLFGRNHRHAALSTLMKHYYFWRSGGIFINLERCLGVHVCPANSPCGRVGMNKEDLYLSFAADCQQMAAITRNEHERLTWLDMAQSWLHLALLCSIQLQPQFNKPHRNAA
jgi:hypothetical protein